MTPTETPIPRPEHPRPQFVRPHWLNLNGVWQFELDDSDSGLERGVLERELRGTIVVPFAPESELSGVADTDFHDAVWYRRDIRVPVEWPDERIILHFQAVDHDSTVWVNGVEAGRHRGGFTPFSFDITDLLDAERHGTVVLRARDPHIGPQARGKQATWFANTDCFYTRTTGIWQTVWLECRPAASFGRPRITPNSDEGTFGIEPDLRGARPGQRIVARIHDDGGVIDEVSTIVGATMAPTLRVTVPASRQRLWTLTDPFLYDIDLTLCDAEGSPVDRLVSYAGLRSVSIDGRRILLNGQPVFQRLVLDQGYWPESLMTAPSDDELAADILRSKAAGFNGARVHEKVAEERFLYHADRLGYLVWGEFADWGSSGQGPEGDNQRPTAGYVAEWVEAVARDYSHPSVIGWCPLNETYQVLHDRMTVLDDVTEAMFRATKSIDRTRPVVDSSGYSHRVIDTDVWDAHDYEQDPHAFALNHAGLADGSPYVNRSADGKDYSLPYRGQPFMVSEFGGIWWVPEIAAQVDGEDREASWGYGQRIADEEEFYARFEGLVRVLDQNPHMFGYCYTQLTDVFQEQNGIYRFDRSLKLDVDRIRTIQERVSAYENTGEEEQWRTREHEESAASH